MADTDNRAETGQRGVCRVCREPIQAGAAKCIHCDSYQDWTRYVLRWSAVLASILAILPLWGIASSLHKLAFSPKTANVEAAVVSCGQDSVTIAYANSGTLDAIVTGIDFSLNEKGNKTKREVDVRPVNTSSGIVVSPNEPPELITYKAYIGQTDTKFISTAQNDPSCSFVFEISWRDFNNSIKRLQRECACP